MIDVSEPQAKPPPPVVRAAPLVIMLEPENGKARVRGAQESPSRSLLPISPESWAPAQRSRFPRTLSARLILERAAGHPLRGHRRGRSRRPLERADQQTYALQLSRGSARLQFGAGQQTLKLSDGRGQVELKVSEQTTLAVSSPGGRHRHVLAGKAELVADGKSTVVQAGEKVNRGSAAAQASRWRPRRSCSRRTSRRGCSPTERPWRGSRSPRVREGRCRVEVAPEPSFSKPLLAGRVGADWVRVEPPARGELHWRFLGEDGAVRTQGSARFEPDRGRSSLAPPRARRPRSSRRASTPDLFQSAPPSLHFTFSPREGARSYQLRLYRAADVKTPILQRVTNKPQYTWSPAPSARAATSGTWRRSALGETSWRAAG